MSAHKISLIVILGLVAAWAWADPSPCPEGDVTVDELLEMATASYQEGHLEKTLQQLEMAQAMIAIELGEPPLPEPPPVRSNAIELLAYLDLYRAFALGSDPEHDAAWSFLTDMLAMVADIESFPDPPGQWRGLSVSTWAGGQVHRIGDVSINHWADKTIMSVGEYRIEYWAGSQVHRIGGIEYDYSAGEKWPDEVGGVDID